MPKRFIHICGASGVGKKTLVKSLIDGPLPKLRERFAINGPWAAYGDKIGHPAAKPMWQYCQASEDFVLHSWQLATHGWIAHNQRAHSLADHRIFLLWQPFELHRYNFIERAIREKSTERPESGVFRRIWNGQMVPLFRQLESWGLNVEVVDVSRDYARVIDWPT